MDIRIGIDLRCLMEGKKTGVEEYARRSAEFLIKKNRDKEIIIFLNSYRRNKAGLKWLEDYENVEIKYFRYPNKLLNFSFWLFGLPKIDKLLGSVRILFMPNIAFGAVSDRCKLILTIHDLSFERMPYVFSLKRRLWHFMINPRKWCRRADQIWAVSKSTGEDIISLYGTGKDKIKIANPPFEREKYHPKNITAGDIERVAERYCLPKKYILFLGTLEPRKNIISVIRAFEQLKKDERYYDLKLVIAGNRGWLWEGIAKRFLESLSKDDIIFTGFIMEKDKPALYHLAEAFVYPSFLEGFGYPPLEAMAAGTPVIAGNSSSLPETTQDAAILIDPYRPFEITQALKELLEDEELRNFYIKKGFENSRKTNTEFFK